MNPGCLAVLGVTGMLGHKVFQRLRGAMPSVIGLARGPRSVEPLASIPLLSGSDVTWGVDVTDFDALGVLLEGARPRVLVNCVGIVKQRSEAKAAVPSITVNSLLPHWLAERMQRWGGRLIHFSTDCVFDGRKGMYTEEDPPNAEDLYGRTKALGEVVAENALTLRTSIIGRELRGRRSLLEWFLAQRGGHVRGYRRVLYSGTTTNRMAEIVEMLVCGQEELSGLYHVSSEPIAKYDLLALANEAFGTGVQIEPDDEVVLDRTMRSDRFRERTGWTPRGWDEMIAEMAVDPTPYTTWQRVSQAGPGRVGV
ncbi:MAG: dTDP-4-dehydrorhamnose reductase family protein [Thermoanaerobaculia bacterium]